MGRESEGGLIAAFASEPRLLLAAQQPAAFLGDGEAGGVKKDPALDGAGWVPRIVAICPRASRRSVDVFP